MPDSHSNQEIDFTNLHKRAPQKPFVGLRIAFKILEMSVAFTPEVSEYKVGTVKGIFIILCLDVKSFRNFHHVVLELDEHYLSETQPSKDWEQRLNHYNQKLPRDRFLDMENGEEEEMNGEPKIVEFEWADLIEPRLIELMN